MKIRLKCCETTLDQEAFANTGRYRCRLCGAEYAIASATDADDDWVKPTAVEEFGASSMVQEKQAKALDTNATQRIRSVADLQYTNVVPHKVGLPS